MDDGRRATDSGYQLTVNSSQLTVHSSQLAEIVDQLPDHLGWGSATLTAVLRARARRLRDRGSKRVDDNRAQTIALQTPAVRQEPASEPTQISGSDTIMLAPSLGLAILRSKRAAAARVWLLLQASSQRSDKQS